MRLSQYDEQAAQKKFDEHISLANTIYWLKAAIEQGTRIFEAEAQPTAHVNSMQFNSRARMEQQFFLTACEKAQRWIDPMNLRTPEAIQFSKLREIIKKVRDEREHDDERYGIGNQFDRLEVGEQAKRGFVLKRHEPGKKPNTWQKFRMEKADTDGGVTIVGTLSGTVNSGNRILLGGIVDVAKVVKAAEALIEPLLNKQHAYWDQKIARMPGTDEEHARVSKSYYIEPRF